MEIQKLQYQNQVATVSWKEQEGRTITVGSTTDPGGPSPEFVRAMQAVVVPTCKVLELPPSYRDGFEFTALTFQGVAGGKAGVVVSMKRPLEAANGPLNLSTPPIAMTRSQGEDEVSNLPKDMQEAVDALLEFCQRFVAGGERSQGELFPGAKADDGDAGDSEEGSEEEGAEEPALAGAAN